MSRIRLFAVAILLVLVGSVAFAAGEQEAEGGLDYPKKDITFMIPFAPGGGTDTAGRLFLTTLEKYIPDVNFIPTNVKGAAGTVAANKLLNSPADGYTMMIAHAGFPVPYLLGNFDKTFEDFSPVAQFATSNMAFYVKGDSPYQSIDDLVAAAKAEEVVIGISVGTLTHFATLAVEENYGVTFRKVSIGGGSPRPPELMSGRVAGYLSSTGEGAPYVASGDFRTLAVYGSDRVKIFPDTPTFKEIGSDYTFDQAFGLWAPPGTPAEIVEYVTAAAKKAVEDPELIAALDKVGLRASYLNAADYKASLAQTFDDCESVSHLIE